MCYFQGQAVGEYCPCCRRCIAYLEVCVPIVIDNGFVASECDFIDFCNYCPVYAECEMMWGKGGANHEAAEL